MASEEGPTSFYDALAPMFDMMTDWDARLATEGPFLREMLREGGAIRVLDAACGSGGHALALARWGYQVTGADASPVMIALARQKAAEAGQAIPFVVSDLAMLALKPGPEPLGGLHMDVAAADRPPGPGVAPARPGKPPVRESTGNLKYTPYDAGATTQGRPHDAGATTQGRPYDAVLCLGNSLPHLLTQPVLVAGLQGIAGVLRPGGLFITQNLNYDLRWQRQPRFFAAQGGVLNGREVLVWRFADYDVPAERIAFYIALFTKREQGRDWDVEVHTTPQRPLFQSALLAALAEAGFGEVQTFGRMALPFEPFDPERSGDLVVVARKADGW